MAVPHPNLWFLDLLQDSALKQELLDACQQDPGPSDMDHVHQVVARKYISNRGCVEGNFGVYARVQLLKELLL